MYMKIFSDRVSFFEEIGNENPVFSVEYNSCDYQSMRIAEKKVEDFSSGYYLAKNNKEKILDKEIIYVDLFNQGYDSALK